MKLAMVLAGVELVQSRADEALEVTRLEWDSRRVRHGDLFFGLPGVTRDGREFAAPAVAQGAAAAVVEYDPEAPPLTVTPRVEVRDAREAMARAAGNLNGQPSHALRIAAVTGTNGKTTTTWLVESIARAAAMRPGVIGTTGYRLGDEVRSAPFTTPEAPDLQRLLREMLDRGIEAVAIEVSSHALHQRRSFGLECDVAVFTNLSHDHLDYHGTLERYLDAKLMLFDGRNRADRIKNTVAVVNLDDAAGASVVAAARHGGLAVVTYGSRNGVSLKIGSLAADPGGISFEIESVEGRRRIRLPLLGRYNAWNATAALGAARALGISDEHSVAGLAQAPAVPGRLEPVRVGQPFDVVVDYAHTPDALERSLAAAREHATGRVLLVFGCGGDRDRAKRPRMGAIAAERADVAWVTSDNPRSEDPARIVAEVRAGDRAGKLRVEIDRRAAIGAAIGGARPGDMVVIAGKGHETTQTIGEQVLPFDDREVARSLMGAGSST